jgi:hypothetical protein
MSIESIAAKKRRRNVSRKYGNIKRNIRIKSEKWQYRAAAAMAAYRRQSAKSNGVSMKA